LRLKHQGSGTIANILAASGEGTIALSASGGMDAENVIPLAGEGRIELSGEGAIVHAPKPVAGEGVVELSASGAMFPVSALQDLFSLTFNLYSVAEAIAGQGGIALTADGDLLALLPTDYPITGEGLVLITAEGAFTNINPLSGSGVIRLGAEWNRVSLNLKPYRVRLDDSRRLVAVDSSRRSVSLDE
jgi:hypothetical protein